MTFFIEQFEDSSLSQFFFALRAYLTLRLGGVFWWFEGGKSTFVSILYRRRGRYAQPFVHSAMAGLVFTSVTFGPLFIAQNFPGEASEIPERLPNEVVLGTSTEAIPYMVTDISEKPRAEVLEYTVEEGDTISSIAEKFGVTLDSVLWANDLTEKSKIKVGQSLQIPPVSGVVHKVRKGDTVYSIAKKYDAEPQAIADYPFNTFTNDETFALAVGQVIIVPDGVMPDVQPVSPRTSMASVLTPDAGMVSATGSFVWPAAGRISQNFSWYHKGLDIANKSGGAILAGDAGTVIVAGWLDNQGYGNRVIVDHGNGYQTLYAHLSRISVSVGQSVNRGDALGLMGCTGRCTGTHLHFEIIHNGGRENPLSYLQ